MPEPRTPLTRATTPLQYLYALTQPGDRPWSEHDARRLLQARGIEPDGVVAGQEAAVAVAYAAWRRPLPDPRTPPDPVAALLHWRRAARSYLWTKGRGFDEDLLSEMVVYRLAHPGQPLSMALVYLRALDVCDPRTETQGVRTRRPPHARLAEGLLPAAALSGSQAPLLPALPAGVPLQGPVRAMLLLLAYYGLTQRELAVLWGVTEGRISHLLRGARQPAV